MKYFYLCNQKKPCRHKELGCVKYGGECRHTRDQKYRKYEVRDPERVRIDKYLDTVWEMENARMEN